MRHIKIIVLFFFLTACASVEETRQPALTLEPENIETPVVKQSDGASEFAAYLRDYVAKNIGDRARTSRTLIDRSAIEHNGRLPSKSLFQSLGYRVRDSFVAMPPQLNSVISDDASINHSAAQLIQRLETTWALLDSTRARLQSLGGLAAGRQDWEVAVVRRNLLLEAIGYWYQLRNQSDYTKWLVRLGDNSDQLFNDISEARQNYDVTDLREQELVLLDLRTDVAELFQFYSSEQARLYNRIGQRVLPEGNKAKPINFTQALQCGFDTNIHAKGDAYLNRYYSSRIDSIRANGNGNVAVYQLNELAREVTAQALAIQSQRLSAVEKVYLQKEILAKEQRVIDIKSLEQRQRALLEIGEVISANELYELKISPLNVSRESTSPSDAEVALFDSITVLADLVASKLLDLNQQRLNNTLLNSNVLYHANQSERWDSVTEEAKVIRALLHEVNDFTLVDYLLGYERLSFTNQMMNRDCGIHQEINSRVIGFEPNSIDQLADVVERYSLAGLNESALKQKLEYYEKIVDAFSEQTLGDGYEVAAVINSDEDVIEPSFVFSSKPKNDGLLTLKQQEFERLKGVFVDNGLNLASSEEVLKFADGDGYTIQIAAIISVNEAVNLIQQFESFGPTLIYRSEQEKSKRVLLKVLVGSENKYEDILNLQEKIGLGWIKPMSDVRGDLYDVGVIK